MQLGIKDNCCKVSYRQWFRLKIMFKRVKSIVYKVCKKSQYLLKMKYKKNVIVIMKQCTKWYLKTLLMEYRENHDTCLNCNVNFFAKGGLQYLTVRKK